MAPPTIWRTTRARQTSSKADVGAVEARVMASINRPVPSRHNHKTEGDFERPLDYVVPPPGVTDAQM
jgi:hypothetical protein